jgi:hypothetical protein
LDRIAEDASLPDDSSKLNLIEEIALGSILLDLTLKLLELSDRESSHFSNHF